MALTSQQYIRDLFE